MIRLFYAFYVDCIRAFTTFFYIKNYFVVRLNLINQTVSVYKSLCSGLVVLDKGEIVEIGSHDELMDAQGAYYALYQAQLRHAAELVEGAAIGESIDENERKAIGLQVISKETGSGV